MRSKHRAPDDDAPVASDMLTASSPVHTPGGEIGVAGPVTRVATDADDVANAERAHAGASQPFEESHASEGAFLLDLPSAPLAQRTPIWFTYGVVPSGIGSTRSSGNPTRTATRRRLHPFEARIPAGQSHTFEFRAATASSVLSRRILEVEVEPPDRFVLTRLTIGKRAFDTTAIARREFATVEVTPRTRVRVTVENRTARSAKVKGQWTSEPVDDAGAGIEFQRDLIAAAATIHALPSFGELPLEIAKNADWTGGKRPKGKVVVPPNVKRRAFAMAAQFLAVALATEADAAAIDYVRTVMDHELRNSGPVRFVGGRGFVHEDPVHLILPWQRALVRVFETVGRLPMGNPFEAVRKILRRLEDECGAPPPEQFVMAAAALKHAKELRDIKDRLLRPRVKDAMEVIDSLYDASAPKEKRIRITLGGGGGTGNKPFVRPWAAAHRFAAAFKVPMPETRSDASRNRSKRET